MLPNPASAVIVPAASAPPVATASQRPQAIRRAALPMACVPAAQAVHTVSHGPCSPQRIEIAAPAALAIIIGTRNGETRRSPFSTRTTTWPSSVRRPPTPVPKIVPNRAGSTPRSPAWSNASVAAAMANCSMRSARRDSLGESYHGLGSQSCDLDRAAGRDARAEQALPVRLPADAAGGEHAEPGDRHAAALRLHDQAPQSLPATRS